MGLFPKLDSSYWRRMLKSRLVMLVQKYLSVDLLKKQFFG